MMISLSPSRLSWLAILLAASVVSAQSASNQNQTGATGDSSSLAGLQFVDSSLPGVPVSAADAMGGGGGQYGGGGHHGSGLHGLASRLTFEFGGGFNAPKSDSITYGGQFTAGGGVRLNKALSALVEYQFLDAKLPGALIAETGATGGYAHIWSLTVDPVVDLFPKKTNSVYITGGGGFYRKVTSFTDPAEAYYCDYFYGVCETYTTNAVVGHFSSNQAGVNLGAGFQHKLGGIYGEGKTRLFVEARYLDVFSPAETGITPSGLNVTTVAADTKLIPVSVGVRF